MKRLSVLVVCLLANAHAVAGWSMLQETRDFARSIEKLLPADFNIQIYDQLLKAV